MAYTIDKKVIVFDCHACPLRQHEIGKAITLSILVNTSALPAFALSFHKLGAAVI
jgi:hypothetical protein